MIKLTSVKLKILVSTLLCVLVFSLLSNLFLYYFLGRIISSKSDLLKRQYIDIVYAQLEQYFTEIHSLANNCANDQDIRLALSRKDLATLSSRMQSIKAQEKMNAYLSTSLVSPFIERLAVFNQSSIIVKAHTIRFGQTSDLRILQKSPLLDISASNTSQYGQVFTVSPSLSFGNPPILSLLYPIGSAGNQTPLGYIYMEISTEIIMSQLKMSEQFNSIFVADEKGLLFLTAAESLPFSDITSSELTDEQILRHQNSTYKIDAVELSRFDLYIYSFSDITPLAGESLSMLYILAVIFSMTLCIGFIVVRILSNSISKPINLLTAKIKKISDENDFSYDPAIEASNDEIGEIGRHINIMALGISHLLSQTEKMVEQRKNNEMALLQSQLNPHFLYNTLDSIRWMAVIQKSNNIANTILALEKLLKNVSKGIGDKITLRDELSLLQDYVHIQSVRFVESFRYTNLVPEDLLNYRIIKFTLQPLVENAIIHGIEPTGRFGSVTVDARHGNGVLQIIVEDDGAGIDRAKLSDLLSSAQNKNKYSLSGIGLKNVDKHLKLVYGSEYGLSVESLLGEYTRVIVSIPEEE